MNDDFMVLNEFVGYGNPKGQFWFIGLEEGGEEWEKPPTEDQLIDYKKRFLPLKAGDIKKRADLEGKKYTKIFDIMSKLVLAVTKQVDPESGNWGKYRNEQLLVGGGDTFQANLYPLSRGSFSRRLPQQYQELFGIGKWYPQDALETRFRMLYSAWKEHHPRLTICFGKGKWRSFEKLLRLEAEPPYGEIDKCRIYRSGVILCSFFRTTLMSHSRIRALAQRLREFEQAA